MHFFVAWDKVLGGQDMPILLAWVANQNTGFTSYCPRAQPAI